MKKRVLAAFIAAVMTLALALPALAVGVRNAVPAPRYPTPAGYNDNDYQKMVAFLELEDDNGVKNGEKISDNYNPVNPGTWYTEDEKGIFWTESSEKRVEYIEIYDFELIGYLNLSGFVDLYLLDCDYNAITKLDVSGCINLTYLYCINNDITEIEVSGCTSLLLLHCYENSITNLDVSGCTELLELYCYDNVLVSLNVSKCTALIRLYCYNNVLK